ncbi:ADAM family of metalloprotease-like protein ADM-B [Coniochaeta sp. 2T2.1]|nr:ADAM family of metalloprotease-like protein ADM-B [Coniochaeta sp. 2T2.1]
MYIPRALVAALAASAGLLSHFATAHSTERRHLNSISRIEDAVIHTPSNRVHSQSKFELSFALHNGREKIRLTLSPNHDILSDDAVINHVGADGTVHRVEPIARSEHRIYKGDAFLKRPGHAEWTNVGWARIAVHRDGAEPVFEGALRIDGDHHHIQTAEHFRKAAIKGDPELEEARADEYMVVWRDSDIAGYDYHREDLKRGLSGDSCTSDSLLFNRDLEHPVYRGLEDEDVEEAKSFWSISPRALFGRQIDAPTSGNGAGVNLASSIGSTAGCPTTRKVALIGIATDCTYTAKFNSTSAIRSHIISTINSASQLYESTFNISLGIQNLTISNETCPSTPAPNTPWNIGCGSTTITDRLNLFSKWRGQFNDNNAFWTLLSTCGTDSAVGLAWLGQACVQGSQDSTANNQNETIAGANVVVWTSTEWQVIAHETGHTFGAVHDCTSQSCSDGTVTRQQCCPLSQSACNANAAFIMNPSTGGSITSFSPCSVGNICSALGRNSVKSSCLTNNRDVNTIAESQCGNGIVEQGEDCDCGGTQGCGTNPCCNPTTCRFTTNAVCDPANEECCTSTCRFASNGTTCRASTGICDPAETCTGSSPVCPSDVTAPDGTSCGGSGAGLSCASGQCTSRDLQCKTLMGAMTTGNDTRSCNSQGCQLSCASPEFGANTCFTMQQNFLDGTTCQGGGKCSNGACKGATVGNEISSWINDNKPIFIPVVSAVGGVIVLAILACCINACRKKRRAKRMPQAPPPGWNPYAQPGWGASRGLSGPSYGPAGGGPPGPGQQPLRSYSARYA